MLDYVAVSLLIVCWLRHSRLGYSLQALCNNEDTAEAADAAPTASNLSAWGRARRWWPRAGRFT